MLADHDRVAVELEDFGMAFDEGADPQHQLLQGSDVCFGGLLALAAIVGGAFMSINFWFAAGWLSSRLMA